MTFTFLIQNLYKMKKLKIIMNKKGVSEILSYILLIVLAIALSGAVFVWLNNYAKHAVPEEKCTESLDFTVSYNCNNENYPNAIEIKIKNRGLFSIDGFSIKYANEKNGGAIYQFKDEEKILLEEEFPLKQNSEAVYVYQRPSALYVLEILPFKMKESEIVYCRENLIKLELENCL